MSLCWNIRARGDNSGYCNVYTMKDIHLAYIIYSTCTSKTYCSFSSASQILHWKPGRIDSSNMFLRWYSLETAWYMKSEQHFSVSAFLQLLCRASNWPLQRTQRQLRSQPACASISPVSLGLDDMDPKLKFTKQRMIPANAPTLEHGILTWYQLLKSDRKI